VLVPNLAQAASPVASPTVATPVVATGSAAAPGATQPANVTAALNAGKAVALIEVTAVKEQDGRPWDGNLVDIVTFKTIKSSGKVPDDIRITKAFGGRRVRPAPVPAGVLFPNPLVAGKRYWMIFNDSDFEKYQQGVVAWWPEKDAPTPVLEAAVAAKNDKPADVTAALNAGKALALIEVTAIREEDMRPADGELFDVVAFKVVKSSGKTPAEIRILKGYAYPQIAGASARGPVPPSILFPNPLVAGQRYWVIFNSADERKYPQGVVAWWPEKDAPAALDAALAAGKFGQPKP
jgi:hypothetical protein